MSAVAHSQAYGLVSHAEPISGVDDATRGYKLAAIGVSAKNVALRYFGALLCTSAMAERMSTLMGLDTAPLSRPTVNVMGVWARIAEI